MYMMQPWMQKIYKIPIQIAIIWLLFIWSIMFRGVAIKSAISIFYPVQKLAICVLALSILLRSALDGWNMIRFGQFVTGIMIAILGIVAFQRTRRRMIIILAMTLGLIMSCGFAFLQYLDFSPLLWQATKYANVGYIYASTGLENNPVAFAYSILGIGVVIIGASLFQWRYREKLVPMNSGINIIVIFFVLTGLVVSKSRSGLLGLILGIAVFMIMGKPVRMKWIKRTIKSGAHYNPSIRQARHQVGFMWKIATIVLVGLLSYAFTVRETEIRQDGRILATWQTYIPVILKNPIGLGAEEDVILEIDRAGSIEYSDALERKGGQLIAPHNLLLTTGISYGPLAALSLFILYATAFRYGRRAFIKLGRLNHRRAAFWILLMISVNVAIVAHSWFHNASIALGDMRNWFWIGLLVHSSSQIRTMPEIS